MIKKLADEIKVALVTGVCILGMAIIFKQILHIQVDALISNGPAYLFIIYVISRRQSKKMKCDKPLYWNLGIIFITVLIIVLYAI